MTRAKASKRAGTGRRRSRAAELERFVVHSPAGSGPLDGVLLILWHGAGGDIEEPSLVRVAEAFAAEGGRAARARFAYRRKGKRAPDRMPGLVADARETIALVREGGREEAVFLGGRSMGGRAASMLCAEDVERERLSPDLMGLLFLSYPLHPANKLDEMRHEHLARIPLAMRFVSGDRDPLAEIGRLRAVAGALGGRASLEVHPGADHGMKKADLGKIAAGSVAWALGVLGRRPWSEEGAAGGSTAVSSLRNVGPVTAERLRALGIQTRGDLVHVGAIEAYRRLVTAYPGEVTLNALYALQGALLDLPWNALPKEMRESLAEEARRRPRG